MHPLRSEQPLIVYVDVKSPYAFVAIRPILALEAELGFPFDWRPLTLDIPSYLGSARKKGGKVVENNRTPRTWISVKYAYMDARRYAEAQGLELRGTEKIWDSSISGIAILWVMQRARERLGDFFEAVYPRFWRRDLDLEDVEVILSCLRDAGVTTDGFEAWQAGDGRRAHDALQAALHDHGIYGVPSFVFEDQVLFGREHLPFIRWHFLGREGPAPDIAYHR